jgi:hypothetical protein
MVGSVAHAAYQSNVALAVMGSTPALVDAKFASVINHNMTLPGAGTVLAHLNTAEWQALAYSYQRVGGSLATLDSMVAVSAPAVYLHYKAVTRGASGTPPFVPPSTGINNTLQEIYLDFRTAPYGGATTASALLETTVFAAVLLQGSYQFGQTVGNGLSWLIQKYDPALDNAIGADIAWVVNLVTNIGNGVSKGFWEWQLDSTFFQVPLDDFGSFADGLGDFGVLDDISIGDVELCINPGDC